MMPHNDDMIRTVLRNGLLLEIQYSAGLIISTRLSRGDNFDSIPDLTPYECVDVSKLDFSRVSEFKWCVYRFLMRTIPQGSIITYGEIARSLGSKGYARAVGTALSNNPWPILVPCHRVVSENGFVGEYNSLNGIETKSKILRSEGLEIGKFGKYDQKNLIKIATDDTDANIQTKM